MPNPLHKLPLPYAPVNPLKVVICWAQFSGYLAACWRALAARPDVDLKIVTFGFGPQDDFDFQNSLLKDLNTTFFPTEQDMTVESVNAAVEEHNPDVIVLCGWYLPVFRSVAFNPKLHGKKFIMGMDTPMRERWRALATRVRVGSFLKKMDRVIVAGERTWQYARALGFAESKIRRGVYGFEFDAFAPLLEQRLDAGAWPRQFLYMGRYAQAKAIDVLCAAYEKYRALNADPWPLACCGKGALASLIEKTPGAKNHGFLQPAEQQPLLLNSGALVIASRYEPWGVALAEAMGAGLPVVCTEACSASLDLVRSYYNGITVPTDDSDALAQALLWIHHHASDLPTMGRRARDFAAAFSAQAWALKWHETMLDLVR